MDAFNYKQTLKVATFNLVIVIINIIIIKHY